jgi:hypothetical protein
MAPDRMILFRVGKMIAQASFSILIHVINPSGYYDPCVDIDSDGNLSRAVLAE